VLSKVFQRMASFVAIIKTLKAQEEGVDVM
jgi:hypothetical protein